MELAHSDAEIPFAKLGAGFGSRDMCTHILRTCTEISYITQEKG